MKRESNITHCGFEIVLLISIFFLSACGGINIKQQKEKNTILTDSIFIKTLTEQQLGSHYKISIPIDYSITQRKGKDFEVYYLLPIDETIQAAIMACVCFSNSDSEFTRFNENCKSEEMESEILDKKVKWTVYHCDDIFVIETIFDSGSRDTWDKFVMS